MVLRRREREEVGWVPPAWDLRAVRDGRVRFGVVMPGLLVGGVEQWLVTLLDWLDAARVVCVGVAQLEPRHLDAEMGRRVERHCPIGLGWPSVRALAERCDVLLVWSEADWRTRVTWPGGCRVVLVAHGESDWTRSVMAEAKYAAGLVAVSEAARRSFPADQRDRVAVIPNGVDPERVAWREPRREVRAAWGVPEEARLIGYLGRFSSEKDCDALIRAVAALPEGWWGAFVGRGWEEATLRESVARVCPGRVVFPGVTADVGSALAAFDWLLLPSGHEGFGLVIAEAWLAGVPVVCTPVGVARDEPDLVRLVPHRATGQELAAGFLADEAQRQARRLRVDAARQIARTWYSAERFGREWTDLLLAMKLSRHVRR